MPGKCVSIDEYDMKDVKDYSKDTFDIEPDQLLNFIKFRRSVRQFKKQPVEDEKILNIIEAGRFTATGSNSQNVSYTVVKGRNCAAKKYGFKTSEPYCTGNYKRTTTK